MPLFFKLSLKRCCCAALLAATLPAWAQAPRLEPLPEPPPPPPGIQNDQSPEPQVTIIQREGETVEEFRIHGRLYMMKITPRVGRPYYLVDERGDGRFSRSEAHDTGVRPTMWVIHSF